MSHELRRRLFDQLDSLTLIDPHTHINPLAPASETLADLLGYHYYTELAHSAGMPKSQIEAAGTPRERVARLFAGLGPIENTIQWSWFLEMCRAFFGLEGDEVGPQNWEAVYDAAEQRMQAPDWADQVLRKSKLSAVFLTNDFDDPLEGFDTGVYIPCLRTDDLVFHLAKPEVRNRLERFTGVSPTEPGQLRQALAALFDHFTAKGARACAISLPPDFSPQKVTDGRAQSALDAIVTGGESCGDSHRRAMANFVFWTLAEFCQDYGLPFDLMIGVNRSVYRAGVHQGRDLYDSRVSLLQYKELFNAFPGVTFPVSVLASVTNQELASYSWIFPNVVCNGHWWYSNTPSTIEHDLAARLEAVPRNKQIGYYSDMYKLEFALPKFAMYKRCLAKVLAERFVIDRGWSEERAVALGEQILRDNTEQVFPAVRREPRGGALAGVGAYSGFATGASLYDPPAASTPEATSLAGMAAAALGGAVAYGAANLSGVPTSPREETLNPLQPSAYESRIEPPAELDDEFELTAATDDANDRAPPAAWPNEASVAAAAEPSWLPPSTEPTPEPLVGPANVPESLLEPLELSSPPPMEMEEIDLAPELEVVSDPAPAVELDAPAELHLDDLEAPAPQTESPAADDFTFDFDEPTPPQQS